ncbi:MAG TPA: hypothetical protein ENH75_12430 [archaeon]|nr:hypothetical protein [archaeon]
MMSEQSFEEENLNQVEEEFKNIYQDEFQMRLIRIFPESIAQYIPVNELTIKEFFNKSIRVWQIDQNKKLSDLRIIPIEEQFSILKTIISHTKSELIKFLVKAEQITKLEFAINEYLYFYKRNLDLEYI